MLIGQMLINFDRLRQNKSSKLVQTSSSFTRTELEEEAVTPPNQQWSSRRMDIDDAWSELEETSKVMNAGRHRMVINAWWSKPGKINPHPELIKNNILLFV